MRACKSASPVRTGIGVVNRDKWARILGKRCWRSWIVGKPWYIPGIEGLNPTNGRTVAVFSRIQEKQGIIEVSIR